MTLSSAKQHKLVHCGNFFNTSECKSPTNTGNICSFHIAVRQTAKCAINTTQEKGKRKLQKSITLVFSGLKFANTNIKKPNML